MQPIPAAPFPVLNQTADALFAWAYVACLPYLWMTALATAPAGDDKVLPAVGRGVVVPLSRATAGRAK